MGRAITVKITSKRLDNDTHKPAPVTKAAIESALTYWGYDVEFVPASPKVAAMEKEPKA